MEVSAWVKRRRRKRGEGERGVTPASERSGGWDGERREKRKNEW
jgi:hypothetical protein